MTTDNTLASMPELIHLDRGATLLLLAVAVAVFVLVLLWPAFRDDYRRTGRKIDAALPDLLDPPAPLSERCARRDCTKRGTVKYGAFLVCKGHDPLRRTEAS